MGAIILLPRNQTDWKLGTSVLSQNYLACNLAAGWGASSINATSFDQAMSATSSLVNLKESLTPQEYQQLLSQAGDKNESNPIDYYQEVTNRDYWYQFPLYPNIPVSMDQAWAEYLNPVVPTLNTTVIDILMKANIHDNDPDATAMIILSGLLANGMARLGFAGTLQGTPAMMQGPDGPDFDGTFWLESKGNFFSIDANASTNWTKFHVDSTVEGYAYNTHGVSPKIAIAFLLTYCVFALAHLLYAGISGKKDPHSWRHL